MRHSILGLDAPAQVYMFQLIGVAGFVSDHCPNFRILLCVTQKLHVFAQSFCARAPPCVKSWRRHHHHGRAPDWSVAVSIPRAASNVLCPGCVAMLSSGHD